MKFRQISKSMLKLGIAGALMVSPFLLDFNSATASAAVSYISESSFDGEKEDYVSFADINHGLAYNKKVVLDLDAEYVKSVKYKTSKYTVVGKSQGEDEDNKMPSHTEDEVTNKISLGSSSYPVIQGNGFYEVFVRYNNGSTDVKRFWIDDSKPSLNGVGDTDVSNNRSKVFKFTTADKDSGIKTVSVGNQSFNVDNTGTFTLSVNVKTKLVKEVPVMDSNGEEKRDEDGMMIMNKVYAPVAEFTLTDPGDNENVDHTHMWSISLDLTTEDGIGKKDICAIFDVTVTDMAGNSTTKTIGWDTIAPLITGVKSNSSYQGTKQVSIYDEELNTVTIGKSGSSKYLNFTSLGLDTMNLNGVAYGISKKDYENNVYQKTVRDGDLKIDMSRNSLGTTYSISDGDGVVAVYSKSQGLVFNAENGVFSFDATDKYGNKSVSIKNVRADSTAPKIKGFTNNKSYKGSVTVTAKDSISGIKYITVNDKRINKNSGKTFTKSGYYNVVAVDKAGNSASKCFSIK